MLPIYFHPVADEELQTSVLYYERQVEGLGSEFVDAVEHAIGIIQEYPEVGIKFSSHTRRYLVERFPFGIIYSIETNRIFIIAIMHLHRKPGYWTNRM